MGRSRRKRPAGHGWCLGALALALMAMPAEAQSKFEVRDLHVRSWPCGEQLAQRCLRSTGIAAYDTRQIVLETEAVLTGSRAYVAHHVGVVGERAMDILSVSQSMVYVWRPDDPPEMAGRELSSGSAKELYEAWRDHRSFEGRQVRHSQRELSQLTRTATDEHVRQNALLADLAMSTRSVGDDLRSQVLELRPLRDFSRAPRPVDVRLENGAIDRALRELDDCISARRPGACLDPYKGLGAGALRSTPGVNDRLKAIEGRNGLLDFSRVFSDVPSSPLTNLELASSPGTVAGRMVRDVANEFQVAWAESAGFGGASESQKAAFALGSAFVSIADRNAGLAGGRLGSTFRGELTIARTLLDVSQGFVTGFAAGLRDAAQLLPAAADLLGRVATDLIEDPSRVFVALARLPDVAPQLAAAVQAAGLAAWDTIANGTPGERAELMGRLGFEVFAAMATGGGVTWLKSTASGATFAARMSSAGQVLWNATAAGLTPANFAAAGRVWLQKVERLTVDVTNRRAFVALAGTDPERALRISGAYTGVLASGLASDAQGAAVVNRLLGLQTSQVPTYMGRLLVARANPRMQLGYLSSSDDVTRIVDKYASLEDRIALVAPTKVEAEVWRAVAPKVELYDDAKQLTKVIHNTDETVFDWHDGLAGARSRYGLGGDEGLEVMSGAVGDRTRAWTTALDEVDSYGPEPPEGLILASKRVTAARVLDLTNPQVRETLNVSLEDLRVPRELPGSYETTQIIGDVAKSRGFDAILAPSAPSAPGGTVFHILDPDIVK